jgi:hypothetical protein
MQSPANRPKLLDEVHCGLRVRHRSRRTGEAYIHWIRDLIVFHDERHPLELGSFGIDCLFQPAHQ